MRFALLTLIVTALGAIATPVPVDLEPVNTGLALREAHSPSVNLAERGTTSVIDAGQYKAWADYAYYSLAAYCARSVIKEWSCGPGCAKASGASKTLLGYGGANILAPRWFVVNNGSHTILSISGTHSAAMWIMNLDFTFDDPNDDWFPDGDGIKLHGGWFGAFKRMSPKVLKAVKAGVAAGSKKVIVTGHSLGGAMGDIFSVWLTTQLGSSATVEARLFGAPRTGNQAWATYTDAVMGKRTQHMIAYNDIVPEERIRIVPPRAFGLRHSSGEIWISGKATNSPVLVCSGQENTSCQRGLSIETKIDAFESYANLLIHTGPYAGVTINPDLCTED